MGILAWVYVVLTLIVVVGLLSAAGITAWLFRRDRKDVRDALSEDIYTTELDK